MHQQRPETGRQGTNITTCRWGQNQRHPTGDSARRRPQGPSEGRWIERLRQRQEAARSNTSDKYNQINATRRGPLDTVILGDSLCKYVDEVRHAHVVAYPGITCWQMEQMITRNKIPLITGKQVIMVHVGTNDLEVLWTDTVYWICHLLTAIVDKYPHAKVVWSDILPRPARNYMYSSEEIQDNIIKINKEVSLRQKHLRYYVCPSHTSFHKAKKPIKKLFAIDYLHLKHWGTFLLRELFRQHLIRLRTIWGMPIWPANQIADPETIIEWNWHDKLCEDRSLSHQ